MIKKLLYQIALTSTIGLGVIILLSALETLSFIYLLTPQVKLVVGVALMIIGLWITRRYGSKYCAECDIS